VDWVTFGLLPIFRVEEGLGLETAVDSDFWDWECYSCCRERLGSSLMLKKSCPDYLEDTFACLELLLVLWLDWMEALNGFWPSCMTISLFS
jgi:hypothetical protein